MRKVAMVYVLYEAQVRLDGLARFHSLIPTANICIR